MVVIGITSCKSDKQKVETLLSDLVEAQTNGDDEKIAAIYPSLNDLGTVIVDAEGAQINFKEADSTYQIVLLSEITFDVKKQTDGNFIITDSHGFVDWNEVWITVFQNTGALDPKMSDMEINQIFNNKEFLDYLIANNPKAKQGNLVVAACVVKRSDDEYSLNIDLRNDSKFNYPWDSYSLELSVMDADGNVLKTEKERGREVRSGEIANFYTWFDGNYTDNISSYNIKINLAKKYGTIDLLNNFVEFTGKEWENYNKHEKGADMNTISLKSSVFQRKLTDDDLKDMSKDNLRKLRNAIYAAHGYIFRDKQLTEYFSSFDWYKGVTTDMGKVSAELNDIEKYNVNFIKQRE